MKLYPLFVLVAAAAVVSPGPGVLMTLTNALRYGFRGTFGGIIGLSFGALIIATVSATSLGILLATSAVAFTVMKLVGAAYLIYLGIRMWRAPAFKFDAEPAHRASFGRRFTEGISLQLTNPKAIFFFLSVFPQFIDLSNNYASQFFGLMLTYGLLVVAIHSIYALSAQRAKLWLTSERGGQILNRVGAATFMLFGIILATAKH